MGTNFYIRGYKDRMDPKTHIGKRSAAGWWCWDCGVSLCKAGASRVHYVSGRPGEWYTACPHCGKTIPVESLDTSSAGRELGFNKTKPKAKRGVASCSSFTWAMSRNDMLKRVKAISIPLLRKRVITDEYDRDFTLKEFDAILKECPIQSIDSIGVAFS